MTEAKEEPAKIIDLEVGYAPGIYIRCQMDVYLYNAMEIGNAEGDADRVSNHKQHHISGGGEFIGKKSQEK